MTRLIGSPSYSKGKTMGISRRRAIMFSGAFVCGVALAGVVAPAQAAVVEPSGPTTSHSVQSHVDLYTVPTLANFTNRTGQQVRIDAKGINGMVHQTLSPGSSYMVAGNAMFGHDVDGTLTYSDGSTVSFWVNNPDLGAPIVGFGNDSNWDHYTETQHRDKTEGAHTFSVTRAHDVQHETAYYKAFLIDMQS